MNGGYSNWTFVAKTSIEETNGYVEHDDRGGFYHGSDNGCKRLDRRIIRSDAAPRNVSNDAVFGTERYSKPTMQISYAMAVACGALYCVKLMAIGLSFPLAYLILYSTEENFGSSVYRGYPIYLYSVGIIFQALYLLNILRNKYNGSSHTFLLEGAFRAFSSNGFRSVTAVFGVVSSFWFLLLFAWVMDMLLHGTPECRYRKFEAAVFSLAFIYTLLHIFVLFYNTKLLITNHDMIALFGIMHLIGTNVSTFGWTSAHFIVMTVAELSPQLSRNTSCEFTSPLAKAVYKTHSYLGVFVLIYFLVSSAVLFSSFAHHYQRGTFRLETKTASIFAQRNFFTIRILFGMTASSIVFCLSVAFVVYHCTYFGSLAPTTAKSTEIMDAICLCMKSTSMLISLALLIVQIFSNPDTLTRQILFETLIISVSLFGLYLHDVTKSVVNFRLGSFYGNLSGADGIVQIFETTFQSTFLLSSLKFSYKKLPDKLYYVEQNCLIYLMMHNFIMAVFSLIQQSDEIYGRLYVTTFNVWFWATYKFYLNSLIVLFRMFSVVFFGSLFVRSSKIEE